VTRSATLLENVGSVADGSWVRWEGGRTALMVSYTTKPTTLTLDIRGKDGDAVSISTISAQGLTSVDLPTGQYRMGMSGGSASAIYADLYLIPHN